MTRKDKLDGLIVEMEDELVERVRVAAGRLGAIDPDFGTETFESIVTLVDDIAADIVKNTAGREEWLIEPRIVALYTEYPALMIELYAGYDERKVNYDYYAQTIISFIFTVMDGKLYAHIHRFAHVPYADYAVPCETKRKGE